MPPPLLWENITPFFVFVLLESILGSRDNLLRLKAESISSDLNLIRCRIAGLCEQTHFLRILEQVIFQDLLHFQFWSKRVLLSVLTIRWKYLFLIIFVRN
jgi:hypothetical protein